MSFKMSKNILICVVLIFYFDGVMSEDCQMHGSCNECIQDPVCVWCPSNSFIGNERCRDASSGTSWCPGKLENPVSFKSSVEDKDFSSDPSDLVQIKPQKYRLKLVRGRPADYSFSFKAVKNYPVDLYFLFDMSMSMATYRSAIAKQAEKIYISMRKLTGNVHMGMGAFVDKNALPYAAKFNETTTYSFRNYLALQNDYKRFEEVVLNTKDGENHDAPEGTLDALAQALVCKHVIDWRDDSRKILLLMTNAYYHVAGEGKLGGIFKPYDGGCYTEDGKYTKELEMDYPSFAMINKLATENQIIVMFVVDEGVRLAYSALSESVYGSRLFLLDKNNDADIASNLNQIYQDMSGKVTLNVNVKSPASQRDFNISFDPPCLNDKNNDGCKVTAKEDEEKRFTGTIMLDNNVNYKKAEMIVTVDGFDDKLQLDIEIINECQCQKDEPEPNSAYCGGHGNRQCGLCTCTDPWWGDRCQCSPDAKNTIRDNDMECKIGDMEEKCNGFGTCSCGVCISCTEGYVGPYCQCLSSNCPMHNNKPCGGRGQCSCNGTCACEHMYSGNACQCLKAEEECTTSNGKICNNRGKCDCNQCQCEPIAKWDSRKDFDKLCVIKPCPECHSLQCKSLTECALCLINDNKDCSCPGTQPKIVDKLPDEQTGLDWKVCSNVRVDVGCYTNFTYAYDEDEYRILLVVQKEKNCVMGYYLYGGIVLGTLLLVGILTLVAWKLMTNYRDKQEYDRFVKDHQTDISPCENPLYEPAYTTFRNPAFRKRSIH